MSRYEALLHTEYFFELAPEDVVPGEDAAMTRAEDIASTAWIFENQDMLELAIIPSGDWYDHPAVGEAACEGCRATTREYFIRAQFGKEDRVYSMYVAFIPEDVPVERVKEIDYEGFAANFNKVIELRRTDWRNYRVFAFVFSETGPETVSEIERNLQLDLAQYVLLKE